MLFWGGDPYNDLEYAGTTLLDTYHDTEKHGQPTGVAVAATTVPLITCTFCIPFFLEHDHLYTIRELNLKRPAW